MNIVFFGTSEFALPPFREILNSTHKVLALVTQPDKRKGRSLKISPPPTKVLALAKNVRVFQPQDASSREAVAYLKKLNADLFVVVSFGQILKEEVLSIPKVYSVNLHGSLLPKYRGAAPTNWAIINGDAVSGITVIKMNEKMDEGNIILKRETKIDKDDTNITLNEKLSEMGAKALLEAISLIETKKAVLVEQDDRDATYAPKLKKEDGEIGWNESAAKIHNKVRALLPWPGAYTRYEGKILKVLKTELLTMPSQPDKKNGTVLDLIANKGIVVKTGSGILAITHLQIEGKKALDADSFLRGHKIAKGYVLGG